MYIQLNLEVMGKRPPEKKIPPNFHEFWSKEVHNKKHPAKRKL
jgi:cephalosporin-C deacetylase-like acetyl esterase